jgi:hypothetical protein
MITLQITDQERNMLLDCMEAAAKHAPHTLQAAAALLPLAQKIAQAQPDEPKADA